MSHIAEPLAAKCCGQKERCINCPEPESESPPILSLVKMPTALEGFTKDEMLDLVAGYSTLGQHPRDKRLLELLVQTELSRRQTPEPLVLTNPEASLELQEVIERHVMNVVTLRGGNKTEAAKLLGIDRRTLYRRLASYKKRASKKAQEKQT